VLNNFISNAVKYPKVGSMIQTACVQIMQPQRDLKPNLKLNHLPALIYGHGNYQKHSATQRRKAV
jgi:hypothetical protein